MATDHQRNLVSCRSVHSIRNIQNTINESVDKVIARNRFWTEDEKKRVRSRFQEIFTSTIQEKILIDGKTWAAATDEADDDEATSEMEPLDPEKMKELNEVVYPALNAQMIETTRQRQHYPHKCVQYFAKQCRAECHCMEKIKVNQKVEVLVPKDPPEDLDVSPELIQSAKTTGQLTKVITEVQDDANETLTVFKHIQEIS